MMEPSGREKVARAVQASGNQARMDAEAFDEDR